MEDQNALEVAQTSTTPEGAEPSDAPEDTSAPNSEETTVEQDASDEESSPSDADPDSEAPRKKGARERIEQLAAEKRALHEAAEYWRKVALEKQEPPKPQEAPKEDPRPTLEQYEYDQDKWAAALSEWTDRQIDRRAGEHVQRTLNEQKTKAEQDALKSQWEGRVAKFSEKHPDFAEVAGAPTVPITKEMFSVMQESELGPDIAYHLGLNPDKAARIARLNPSAQMVAIGRLEAELSKPAPKPQPTKAPAPPNPVGGQQPSKDPSKMTIDEWMAFRRQELRNRS